MICSVVTTKKRKRDVINLKENHETFKKNMAMPFETRQNITIHSLVAHVIRLNIPTVFNISRKNTYPSKRYGRTDKVNYRAGSLNMVILFHFK